MEDEYGKSMVNAWWFRMADGVEVILVSNLVRDRNWMEDRKPEGHTPWMHLAFPISKASAHRYEGKPMIHGSVLLVIDGRGRVNMDHVAAVTHKRVELEGSLPE